MLGDGGFERWDAQASHCVARGVGSIDALSADGALTATRHGRVLMVNDAGTGAAIYRLGDRPNTPIELGNLGRHYTVSANPIYPMIAAAAPDGHVRLWDSTLVRRSVAACALPRPSASDSARLANQTVSTRIRVSAPL